MLGIIPDFIASVTCILLPAYISYKALRSKDPAQSHPWLIYFTILSLTFLFEQWTYFILGWVPFYAWFRLCFLLYLVLPQTQGAKIIYLDYLEPYIVHHENQIDDFITSTHTKLQQMGMGYVNRLIELIRERILGQASPQSAPEQQQSYASYATDFLSRFTMPQARPSADAGGGIYTMMSGLAGAALGAAGARTRTPEAEAASIPDTFFQDNLKNANSAQRLTMITAQRERLQGILKALETEQQSINLAYGSSGGLGPKSRSEQSFVNVDQDDVASKPATPPKPVTSRHTSGGWMSAAAGWVSGSGSPPADKKDGKTSSGWGAARDITEAMAQGISSSLEREEHLGHQRR